MKITPLFSAWGPKSLCAAALLITACGNQREVRQADEAYQQALALNDVMGQRRALLALTRAEDGVSEYWMRLAQVELQIGAFGDAYAHLSRAHELDRTAVPPLSMMTELAVRSGELELAEDHLKKLAVIAPNDRAVALARGFVALRQSDYEKAQENVDILLSQYPGDSLANVLQSRILVAQRKFPEAIEQLGQKLAINPEDQALLRSLAATHRYLKDWEKAAAAQSRLWRLSPSDAVVARQVVSDALRAKNVALAREVTKSVIESAKAGNEVDGLLAAWTRLAPSADKLPATLGTGMPDHSRIALAHHFNQTGRAAEARSILGDRPRAMGERANVQFNAVFAEALSLSGQSGPARQILDRILRDEPDHAVALSARARLLSRSGDHRSATIDAQRLVASYGAIPDYRVLLANIYRASRDRRAAERTLWNGYRDLPGDETLFEEVRLLLNTRGDNDALSRFETDHDEERFSRLMKELA